MNAKSPAGYNRSVKRAEDRVLILSAVQLFGHVEIALRWSLLMNVIISSKAIYVSHLLEGRRLHSQAVIVGFDTY